MTGTGMVYYVTSRKKHAQVGLPHNFSRAGNASGRASTPTGGMFSSMVALLATAAMFAKSKIAPRRDVRRQQFTRLNRGRSR